MGLSACLVVVAGVSLGGQRVAELTSGKDVAAPVGTSAPTREYDVRADRIVLARAVRTGGAGGTGGDGSHVADVPLAGAPAHRPAAGVFVVVRWTAWSATEPVEVHEPRLVSADGRSFAPRVGLGQPAGSARLVQPGFALSWTTVFDVPPQLVLGAELVVPPARWQAPLYDVTIHVPLTSSPVMDDVVAGSDENRLHQDSGGPVR